MNWRSNIESSDLATADRDELPWTFDRHEDEVKKFWLSKKQKQKTKKKKQNKTKANKQKNASLRVTER